MDEMKTWGRLSNDERREVIKFMKRRTKYGSADPLTMLIVAFVVAVIGLIVMALVGK